MRVAVGTDSLSSVDDLTKGSFHPLLIDAPAADPKSIRKIILCNGKIYYDLASVRDERKAFDTVIVRVEQLYPFPEAEFAQLLATYPAAGEVISTLPSGKTARTSRARIASFTFSLIRGLGPRGG